MKRVEQIRGFTLLEALTAMAIIAVLMSLLIPAIGKIQTIASVVKQRAQFNAIEVGLEAFRSDSRREDYPPSSYTRLGETEGRTTSGNNKSYSGAQKLAEALVGQDGFGFHPKSQWRSDGLQDINGDGTGEVPLYYGSAGFDALTEIEKASNLGLRKGPYLELEKANAVKLSSIYASSSTFALDTYVFADMFRKVKNLKGSGRTGMPILYFRANTSLTWSTSDAQGVPTTPQNCIYNVYDNYYACLWAKVPWGDTTLYHPMHLNAIPFYQRVRNPNFPGTAGGTINFSDARPYRADSFILLSAGPDGLYGSADDIYNFEESE
jgi:prepilin-type N-terminal cleavage/methylation domain-containing protein